jgi:hypothetical protein
MPYKNAAAKQQWEREHREQRNAKRRRRPLAAQLGATVSISAPDPRFQSGAPSPLSTANSGELELGYVVAFLMVFIVGLGLAIHFARAGKRTAHMQPDPARNQKES